MIVQDTHKALPPLITAKEAAELARCSVNHVTAMCRAGKVKATRCGTHWRINRDAWLDYLGITA